MREEQVWNKIKCSVLGMLSLRCLRHPNGNVERIIIYSFRDEVTDGSLSHHNAPKELDENT